MSPQFVDYDGDGHLDIVAGTFNGSPHVAFGGERGFRQPVQIRDRTGERIVLNEYWDHGKKQWQSTKRCDPPGHDLAHGHGTSAVAFDVDGDGDLDLLLGDHRTGHVYVRVNEGSVKEPAFATQNEVLLAAGKPIDVPGTVATLRLIDWDGDGRLDLLVGSMGDVHGAEPGGGVYLYPNTGDDKAARFGAPVVLIERSLKGADGPTRPDSGLYPDAFDIDGDGDLDLVVGGYSNWQPKAPDLTEEQQARVVELRAQIAEVDQQSAALNRALYEATKGMPVEAAEKKRSELAKEQQPQRAPLSKKRQQLQEELEPLAPSAKRIAFVWLYENLAKHKPAEGR